MSPNPVWPAATTWLVPPLLSSLESGWPCQQQFSSAVVSNVVNGLVNSGVDLGFGNTLYPLGHFRGHSIKGLKA